MKTPGHGFRTPAKHSLMHKSVGQEVGALSRIAFGLGITQCKWFDHTAGHGIAVNYSGEELPDAELDKWERGCSVGILTGQAMRAPIDVVIRAYEKAPNTFDTLSLVLADRLGEYGFDQVVDPTGAPSTLAWVGKNKFGSLVVFEAFHGSGHDAYADDVVASDAVFSLNDPNAMPIGVAEWAMRPDFAAEISARTKWVRMLHTMGCNVGGIKRLDRTLRDEWFNFIASQRVALHPHHDMVLGAIERDASQWAYMLRTARKWKGGNAEQMRKSFNSVGKSLAVHSYKEEPDEFRALLRQLFLTRNELEGKAS